MKKIILLMITIFYCNVLLAQQYTANNFVGVWYGTIEGSDDWGDYEDEIVIDLKADGTYTESTGKLMPTIYPNTQSWDFDSQTNRLHFKYLQTVYAGQRFYQHFYYEIVNFNDNMFELHYNFWDDSEPHPDVQKIVLSNNLSSVKEKSLLSDKKLIRITDITGKEIPENTVGIPMIYQYNDGTIEKKLMIK